MLTRICLFALIGIIAQHTVKAQYLRQYARCDSTEYQLNADTNIIVGKSNLYYHIKSDLQLLYRFDMPFKDYFIRDFDIIKPDLWYTLVGDRFIGNLTFLYRSTDRGHTWAIDTSHFAAIDTSLTQFTFDPFDPYYYNSINQVQEIGKDTVLLFLGYYGSGIAYSTDAGKSWSHWFANSPAHYYGIFECKTSYYLFQLGGDGFRGLMFSFDKAFLFRNDSLVNFDHSAAGSGHHPPLQGSNLPNVIYYSTQTYCDTYSFLEEHVQRDCNTATLTTHIEENTQVSIYPNPGQDRFTIEMEHTVISPVEVIIYSVTGSVVYRKLFTNTSSFYNFEVSPGLKPGVYYLTIQGAKRITTTKKIIIQ